MPDPQDAGSLIDVLESAAKLRSLIPDAVLAGDSGRWRRWDDVVDACRELARLMLVVDPAKAEKS